jgi:hypothetical protein
METSDVEAVPVFHAQLKDDTPVARWKSSGLYVAEVETMEGPMGPSGGPIGEVFSLDASESNKNKTAIADT